jgi:hypothetical protein
MWTLHVVAFGVSALAGLAALLRSDTAMTRKTVAAHVLNAGVLGLGISLVWYSQFRDNVHLLVGLCVIVGLGGMSSVEFFTNLARNFMSLGKK